MKVQVVTDSGADIPKELASDLGITVVPLTVSFGNQSYIDGIELSPDEFYQRLTQSEVMPTTSQPSVGSFADVYKEIRTHTNQILSIHLSAKLSGTLNSASQAAAQENLGESIHLIDSQQVSIGLGFSVIAAAEAAREGASLAEAAAVATSVLDRTQVFVLLDTLDYLEKGGRIGKASALLGSIFQIKPILTVENGEVATKSKARTFKKGLLSLQQFTEECGELERAGILYSTDDTEAKTFAGLLNNSFVKNATPSIIRLSPVIGAHGGPGVVGAVCVTSKK